MEPPAGEEMGIMAIALTEQKTEQTAETTSCEQKAMTWWETSKKDDSETPTVH